MRISNLKAACVLGSAVVVTGLAYVAGCSSTAATDTISYSPITSLIVRAEAARGGKGCGQGATDVFKYAAVLRTSSGTVVGGALYDCFTDAAFRDPPFDPLKPSPTFKIDVYAFDQATVDGKGIAALAAAARNGDAAVLGATTVACEATPVYEVEVVAVCSNSSMDAGASSDAGNASDARTDAGSDADASSASDASDVGDASDDAADAL